MSDIPRKSLETFVFKILSQGAGILTGIILARTLGPSGKGGFTYVTAVFAVFLALNAGQSSAVSWQYGRLKRLSGNVFEAMLRILGYGGLPLALILATVALVIPGQRDLLATAIALPFGFFSQMGLGFYLADGKIRLLNVQLLIGYVGFLLVMVPAVLIFHFGLTGVLVCWVFAYVATAVYTLLMLKPYASDIQGDTLAHLKEQAAFGLKASVNSLLVFLNFQIDIFIIRFALGVNSLGVYSIAIGVGELLWKLTGPLGSSAFSSINSGSRAESAALTAKCLRHSLAIMTAACVLLYFVGPPLIPLVYGKAFAEAGTVLRFLIPGIIAYSVMPFLGTFFTQQLGRPSVMFRILSLSTVVCAAITLAAVGRWGIVAGAVGTSVSYSTAFIVGVILFKRETGMSARALFGFRREDIQPYRVLASSLLTRALDLTLGRRG